jgi:hypothetical protein
MKSYIYIDQFSSKHLVLYQAFDRSVQMLLILVHCSFPMNSPFLCLSVLYTWVSVVWEAFLLTIREHIKSLV